MYGYRILKQRVLGFFVFVLYKIIQALLKENAERRSEKGRREMRMELNIYIYYIYMYVCIYLIIPEKDKKGAEEF